MAELTKGYFDDRMSTLRQDVGDVRRDVSALRSEMNSKFDAMFELLDVRKKIEQLENDMRNVKHELKLA